MVGAAATSNTATSNEEAIELNPGAAISQEVRAGEKRTFEVSLRRDQVLRFSVDKADLALALALYDPAGKKLIEFASHRYETLDLSFPADSDGNYRLEVVSLEQATGRQCQFRMEPLRNATAEDRKDYAARQTVARASVLRADWTEKSLRQAVENYDEAAATWLSSRNFQSAAVATMAAGEACLALGEYRESLRRYQKAAAVAGSAGAKLEASEALGEVGRLFSYLGNNDEAQKQLLRALDFLAPESDRDQVGTVKQAYAAALSQLGEVNYSKGDLVKSSDQFAHALKLFKEVGDRSGEARAHLFIGYITGSIGEPQKAVAEILEALRLYRAVSDRTGEGLCLTVLGTSYSLSRDEERAIKMHRQANEIFRVIGDRQSEALTLNGLGQSYEYLGQYPTALENYLQALRLLQDNAGFDMASVSMFKIARVYRLLGNIPQALTYYRQCLEISRRAKKFRTAANALNEVALMYAAQGSRRKTIEQYQEILKFYEGIGDRRGQAIALNELGDFLLRVGDKKKALELYQRALPLSESGGNKGAVISNLYDIARAERALGAFDAALAHVRHSIEIIESLRTNFASPEFRTSYFADVRNSYDLEIDILMQLDRLRPGQGFVQTALLTSERGRARSLVDSLAEARVDIRQGAPDKLVERERELEGLLRSQAQYQMDLSIGGKSSPESEEVARQIVQLRAEYQEIEGQIRDQNPRVLTLAKATTLTLEQIQAELIDDNTILLEYALGDERSYLWVVTRRSLRSYELPSRATLEAAAKEVYELLTARQTNGERIDMAYPARVEAADQAYYKKALTLSQMLLGPVAEELESNRLIVVPEGVLQYIPFDALPTPLQETAEPNAGEKNATPQDSPPLIVTHEIVTLPSIATLAAIRQEKRRQNSSNKIVAVLADPVFTSNDDRVENGNPNSTIAFSGDQSIGSPAAPVLGFDTKHGPPRLVHASEEADAILAATPRSTGMVARGFEANRETAMSSLVGEYKIVHFATHGFLNNKHPELSGLVLSMVNRDGSKTDGFMPLHDIYNLNLSADLVVLSACDTGLGKDIKGEGLVGLTRGFMAAGSKSVVASLWKVDDRATAALMADFYRAMLQDGVTPAAALRSAKQKIRQEKAWSAPYFWAGFVIQGEFKEPIVVTDNSWIRVTLALSLALAVILVGLLILRRQRRAAHLAPGS